MRPPPRAVRLLYIYFVCACAPMQSESIKRTMHTQPQQNRPVVASVHQRKPRDSSEQHYAMILLNWKYIYVRRVWSKEFWSSNVGVSSWCRRIKICNRWQREKCRQYDQYWSEYLSQRARFTSKLFVRLIIGNIVRQKGHWIFNFASVWLCFLFWFVDSSICICIVWL